MKKNKCSLNLIFSVTHEMIKDNGEDSFCFCALNDRFMLGVFDGCGGSGSKKYAHFSGKTGAYMASHAVCGAVYQWFAELQGENQLQEYVQSALSVCMKYEDRQGRMLGSLGKLFPTTAAILVGEANENKINVCCYWAGDSRCYILNADGLRQLTADDLNGQDAMNNLKNDGVMTNVINGSVPFEIHCKKLTVGNPCIFLTATDGCFSYLNSPMEFENLLLDSLIGASSVAEWKQELDKRMFERAGDDYTLCVASCGFDNFYDMQNSLNSRKSYVAEKYICSKRDVDAAWNQYKKEYSKYL